MKAAEFYQTLDHELENIMVKESDYYKKIHNFDQNQKKSRAFLIWFLQFYSIPYGIFSNVITDGNDDWSCDLIFPLTHYDGSTIYYLVQAKWCNQSNCLKQVESIEVSSALNRFNNVLNGSLPESENEAFQTQYQLLKEHLKRNGKFRCFFLTLRTMNEADYPEIAEFKKTRGEPTFEIADFHRLKRDYIDFKYKALQPENPLLYRERSDKTKYRLPIIRKKSNAYASDYLTVEKPFDAINVLVTPRTIYELFERFGYSLFIENFRNPIVESEVNLKMIQTLQNEPTNFWYYNNGITAVAPLLELPQNPITEELGVGLMQIINGAQTVYSVHKAYKAAGPDEQDLMNAHARISLRLIQTSDKYFTQRITRFANSQNAVEPRDFWANDPIQLHLQECSFESNIWYEIKKGEFLEKQIPENVLVIPNGFFGVYYLCFFLEKPHLLLKEPFQPELLFISKTEQANGIYEVVFNSETRWNDLLASFIVGFFLEQYGVARKQEKAQSGFKTGKYLVNVQDWTPYEAYILPIFKHILSKYLVLKYPDANLSRWLIQQYEKDERYFFQIILKVLHFFEKESAQTNSFDQGRKLFLSRPGYLEYLKDQTVKKLTSPESIELMELSDEDNTFIEKNFS
jgi:hypothetical protein